MSGVRKFLITVVVIAVCGLVSVGTAYVFTKTAPKAAENKTEIPPQRVQTITLKPEDRIDWVEGYGTARPYQVATLTAQVNATVLERIGGLKAGVPVKKGQQLLQLDDREYEEQLARARQTAAADEAAIAQLDVERDNLKQLIAIAEESVELTGAEVRRVKNLYVEGNASESEYNRVRLTHQNALQSLQQLKNQLALIEPRKAQLHASLEARRNDAAIAKLNVARCRITAPFDAQVDEMLVEVGDSVRIGSPLIRIVALDRIEVPLEIPASRRRDIQSDAECVLTVESIPGTTWHGTVERIDPTVDERSRTLAAFVEVDNTAQPVPLVPGYFVRARIKGPTLENTLAVPRQAITNDRVYVYSEGKAATRTVRVQRYIRDLAVITGDISPGDQVIATNLDVLYEGAPVQIANRRHASTPPTPLAPASPPGGA